MPLAGRFGPPEPFPPADGFPPPPNPTEVKFVDNQDYVADTFINKTAVSPETYAEVFKLLQRYSAGSRIQVTYFLRSTSTAGLQRSDAIDPSSLRNPVSTNYTEIREFEIVVQGKGLQSSFSQDNQETRITGEALLYPGMKPRNGDLFLTPIGDGTYGVFQVTGVERLTYRQGANHRITFFMREYATNDEVAIIRQSVSQTLWFDKETYLGDATTLLKHDSFMCLKAMRQMRPILIRHYYNTFFDASMNTIIAPDGSYDPYLVQYLNGKISVLDSIRRPNQLYSAIQNYDNSLWSRLTEVTNRTLIGLQPHSMLQRCQASRWDVSITSLVNRVIVTLDNPNKLQSLASVVTTDYNVPDVVLPGTFQQLIPVDVAQSYIFSPAFYAGDKAAMLPFEFLVYAVIADRKLNDPVDFVNSYLNRYSELTPSERYYFIPLYLWLIDVGIEGIAATDSFMT